MLWVLEVYLPTPFVFFLYIKDTVRKHLLNTLYEEKITMKNEERKVRELRSLLHSVTTENKSKAELQQTIMELVDGFIEFPDVPDRKFYSLIPTINVPSDIRVEYIYIPTYIACGIMMYAVVNYPALMNNKAFKETFYNGLNGCTGRKFSGHGYDSIKGFLDTMDIFSQSKVMDFIGTYPEFNPEFSESIIKAVDYIEYRLKDRKCEEYSFQQFSFDRAALILQRLKGINENQVMLFVYGTLMKNQRANKMLEGSQYCGKFMLRDYAMYDLGAYPGIKEKHGENVVGEVYAVERSLLAELDRYEGEGSLYNRKMVTVINDKEIVSAFVYVYRGNISNKNIVRTEWGKNERENIWYACYGSNLSEKRFLCYLEGGTCELNDKTYSGCSDKSYFKETAYITVNGEMYFGNSSSSWNGNGVAFFDPETDGTTNMKLYQINYSQLMDLQRMEGKSANWYGRICCIGIKDDLPVYTLTSEKRRPKNLPDEKYFSLIAAELKEQFSLSDREAISYIAGLILRSTP